MDKFQGLHDTPVALLAEGVDRNWKCVAAFAVIVASPSSRRAWIEISSRRARAWSLPVALLAEGVDRNIDEDIPVKDDLEVALLAEGVDRNLRMLKAEPELKGRPPRGGRG